MYVGSYGIGRKGGGLEYICWLIWYWEERRRIRIYLLAYMILGGEEEDYNVCIVGLYGIGRRRGGL